MGFEPKRTRLSFLASIMGSLAAVVVTVLTAVEPQVFWDETWSVTRAATVIVFAGATVFFGWVAWRTRPARRL